MDRESEEIYKSYRVDWHEVTRMDTWRWPSGWVKDRIMAGIRRYDQQIQDLQNGIITANQFQSLFTTGLSAKDIREALNANAAIVYFPTSWMEDEHDWLSDAIFAQFHARYLTPLPDSTYLCEDVANEDRPGSEVLGGAMLLFACVFHIVYPENAAPAGQPDYQIALMTPSESRDTLCSLYAADIHHQGWHPVKGCAVPRLNVEELRSRPLPEVINAAIRIGCHEISGLDFMALYPKQIRAKQLRLHLMIEHVSPLEDNVSAQRQQYKIYGLCAKINRHTELPRINSWWDATGDLLGDVVEELGGLGDFEPVIHCPKMDPDLNKYYGMLNYLGRHFPQTVRDAKEIVGQKGKEYSEDGSDDNGGDSDMGDSYGSQTRAQRKRRRV